MTGALGSGIRVLDFTNQRIAGPHARGCWPIGAEVIQIGRREGDMIWRPTRPPLRKRWPATSFGQLNAGEGKEALFPRSPRHRRRSRGRSAGLG